MPAKQNLGLRRTVHAALAILFSACVVLCRARPAAAAEYAVGEGDVLQIAVFDHPDLATTARVNGEGLIRFPLIGQVYVGGLTLPRVADVITARLSDGYIIGPAVTVTVQEYRTRRATVVGKVNHPGVFEFRGQITLLELLSRAGGPSVDAGSEVFLKGPEGSARAGGRSIDLRALLADADAAMNVPIGDGDTLVVQDAGVFVLTGEVRRPGEYRFEPGMTLLRAVALAGGFTERAAADRVKIVRSDGEREQLLEVGAGPAALDRQLHRGDIVVVAAARSEVCYVTGEVKSAGVYRCERDTTVLKAVTLAGGFTDAAAKNKIRIVRRVDGQEQVRDKVGFEEPVLPDDILVVPKSFF